jgi:hypothetical protein
MEFWSTGVLRQVRIVPRDSRVVVALLGRFRLAVCTEPNPWAILFHHLMVGVRELALFSSPPTTRFASPFAEEMSCSD